MALQPAEPGSLAARVRATIEPSIEALGYAIVQMKLSDGKSRRRLEIMAERLDGQSMSFDDCAEISRSVSALLDVEDPIPGAYDLEVVSPGIDRPLTKPEDFKRFAGHEAKMETVLALDGGRKRFRGVIGKVTGQAVTMTTQEGEVEIAFSNVRTAKLMLTDALISQHLREASAKQKNERKHKQSQ